MYWLNEGLFGSTCGQIQLSNDAASSFSYSQLVEYSELRLGWIAVCASFDGSQHSKNSGQLRKP